MDAFGWMRWMTAPSVKSLSRAPLDWSPVTSTSSPFNGETPSKHRATPPFQLTGLCLVPGLSFPQRRSIRVGEFEGGTLELAELETDAPVSPDAVLAEFAGEKPSTMEAALDEAARE